MKIYKALKKDLLIKQIREGFDDHEVYISLRPCIDIVIELLENGPNLSVIYCPPSLFELTSSRVKNALEKVNVRLRPMGGGAGRPKVYDSNDVTEIKKLISVGLSITRISQELDIPRRTIYHLLNKEKAE
ncbi:MAG: helix-turn-helix domain-containing protein [Candidatus Methanofastidiosa archaeon]|nr:helix-turn-helix domain-containing protein [Candidatus Methanofastidiosa archaeon]